MFLESFLDFFVLNFDYLFVIIAIEYIVIEVKSNIANFVIYIKTIKFQLKNILNYIIAV